MRNSFITILLLWGISTCFATPPVRIYGYILDEENSGVELTNIVVEGTTTGTVSNKNGYYELWVEMPDTITMVYSMLGYTTLKQRLYTTNQTLGVNVVLTSATEMLEAVEVRGTRQHNTMMERLDATVIQNMPDASGGNIESILVTYGGVNQNNEMSSQYNVRGGSYDENSVYVNGIEIHRPLLIRASQQEGLSFVNPKMVNDIMFSAGGFGAQYGDKSSSVLDITYKQPKGFEASIDASLLGGNVYIGHGNDKVTGMYSARYKVNQYVLNSLQQEGSYDPRYVDIQSQMTFKLTPGWRLRLMGYWSQNNYNFHPDSMSNSFGTMNDAKNLTIYYEGQERDVFKTGFAAISVLGHLSEESSINIDLSGHYSKERENYDIHGDYILQNQFVGVETSVEDILGMGEYHEHARNFLRYGIATLSVHGDWTHKNNNFHWGVSVQGEWIDDNISEWEWRDSTGYSLPLNNNGELYYSMKGKANIASIRLQGFLENTYLWHNSKGDVVKLTMGMRMQYWSWNKEVLISPRASVSVVPGSDKNFVWRLATGLYYQAPFYKEIRDTMEDGSGVTRIQLNHDIRAQRNVHVVIGEDHYFRFWGRPFKLTTEIYGKYTDRGISYTVDNVRVRYSGVNDIEGYTIGLDAKIYGEFVPGIDSWLTFSFMKSRERFIHDVNHLGWRNAPQDQRYNISIVFQDYLPQLPQLRAQVKFIIADGLPYGVPHSIQTRNKGRMSNYKRFDLGLIHVWDKKSYPFMRKSKVVQSWSVGLDVFNVIDFKNVNSYFWVGDAYGHQWASPNYLSGRRWNVKLSVNF